MGLLWRILVAGNTIILTVTGLRPLIKIVLAYKNEVPPAVGKFVEIITEDRLSEWSDIQGLMYLLNGKRTLCD